MNIFINKGNLEINVKQTNSGGDWVDVTNENQDEIVVKCASTVKNGTSFYQFTKTELDLSQILSNYTDSSVINKKIYLKVKSKTVNQILVNEKIYDIKGNYLVLNLKELLVDTQVLTLSFNQQENTEKSVIFEYNDSYPYIKLENLNSIYTDEEIKEIDLAGGCNANVVLGSGENILSFNDITDNAMGLSIGHIFRHGKKNDGKGVGFKLSLNERFYKNGDGYYYYEDGLGNLTKLESKFYYYQEGEKKVVSEENYSKIYYDENGKYFYKESENLHFEAFKESFNVKGLKTIEFEDNENIKYTFLSDKRTENIKQYEETIKNLKEKLNDFVTLDIETKEYVKVNILFSEDYNLTAKKILELIDNLQNNKTVIISETEAKKYINKIKDINNFNLFSDETKEKLINEINNEIIKNQKEYSKIFKNSYAEYYTLIQNYKKEKSQTAINFIQDGEIYKGFNYYGDLINVFDKFENYTVIEYGLSKINGEDLYKRIESVYNSDNKQIIFEYDDENGLLKSIISSTGQRTDYTYDTNNYLTKVEFNGKENFTLTYSDDGLITSITDSDKLKSQITYSGQKVASVKNISLISSISATSETESESDVITYNFTYSLENGKNSYCIVSYDDVREKFVLNTSLKTLGDLIEYYLEKNNKVVEANKNSKIYFWGKGQIYYDKAKIESLNKYSIENFSFSECDRYIEFLDKINEELVKGTIPILTIVIENIGFYFWLLVLCFAYCVYKKQYKDIVMLLPILGLWVTTIAAPMVDLRFIYSMFLIMPVYIGIIAKNSRTKYEKR